jgi:peptidoglycan hydrolase CwlO-like protein
MFAGRQSLCDKGGQQTIFNVCWSKNLPTIIKNLKTRIKAKIQETEAQVKAKIQETEAKIQETEAQVQQLTQQLPPNVNILINTVSNEHTIQNI